MPSSVPSGGFFSSIVSPRQGILQGVTKKRGRVKMEADRRARGSDLRRVAESLTLDNGDEGFDETADLLRGLSFQLKEFHPELAFFFFGPPHHRLLDFHRGITILRRQIQPEVQLHSIRYPGLARNPAPSDGQIHQRPFARDPVSGGKGASKPYLMADMLARFHTFILSRDLCHAQGGAEAHWTLSLPRHPSTFIIPPCLP